MSITEKGLAVIRSFEGRALKAYLDSAGVVTIGYGTTNYDSFAVSYLGKKIALGDTITEEQAEYLLRESIDRNYAPAVAKAMPGGSAVEQDGGISFHYNTGAIGRASWVAKWKAKADFKAALMSWNKAGGKELAGLTRRRAREYAIIRNGDYGPEGDSAPPVLNAAGNVVKAATPGMLSTGATGPEVADLNTKLAQLGFKVSGDSFGADTEKAVRSFQAAHKQLSVDGIAGPATRAAINREIDATRKVSNTVKTGVSALAASGGADLAGAGVPVGVYVTIAIIFVVAIGFFAWKYRDEFAGAQTRGAAA